MQEQQFWLVWNPNGHAPTHKHTTNFSANAEAERLARNSPGQMFFVLQVIGGKVAPNPVQDIVIDDIPF